MSKVKETGVGILFIGALVGLGFLTVALTDFDLFRTTHDLTAYFDKASGLKAGDNVRVMGVIRGKVRKIEFLATPVHLPEVVNDLWVKATLTLDVPVQSFLRRDYVIRIRNSNMLGGKVVDIELGSSDEAVMDETVARGLPGLATADPFEQVGDLIGENRPRIDRIIENVDLFAAEVTTLAKDIREGDGVAHDLIYNETMAERVRLTLADIGDGVKLFRQVIADVREGRGVLGQILYNEDWPAQVTAIIDSIRGIIDEVKTGEGVLGQIIFNQEWSERVTALLTTINEIVSNTRAGKGPLGLLLYDEKLRADIASSVENFEKVSAALGTIAQNLQEGKGLLGTLLADEEMALKVRALLDQALMSLEDAREAAPLSSLGSFLFGSF